MKKPHVSSLLVLTTVFVAFTLGLFLGRNQTKNTVILSLPPALQTAPPETTRPSSPPETAPSVCFPIDINTAGKEEFMALPGIGDVLAQRIVAYREVYGPFGTVEGLMYVEGIGEKRMEDIWDLIIVGG